MILEIVDNTTVQKGVCEAGLRHMNPEMGEIGLHGDEPPAIFFNGQDWQTF